MRESRGCEFVLEREPFSKTRRAEQTAKGLPCEKCPGAKLSGRAATETSELKPVLLGNEVGATRFIAQSL